MAILQFREYIDKENINIEVIETTSPTRTAQEAADVHGVPVSNIVKSLLVKTPNGFELHLTPGDRRLEMDKNSRMANADEVKSITGYSIGGVPPFGHNQKIKTFIEDGFDGTIELVAAGGSMHSVFKISLEDLKKLIS